MYGLSGIFNNGVASMMAFSEATGTLSDNIANLQTVGYKRVQTDFATVLGSQRMRGMVTPNGAVGTPFGNVNGVVTSTRQLVGLQGPITATGRATDLAINGGGMFVFGNGTFNGNTLEIDDELLYSRAGNLQTSISPIAQGTADADGVTAFGSSLDAYLTNRNGQYLLAYQAATVPGTGGTVALGTTLVPVQISNLATFPGQATTFAELSCVIPAPSTAAGARVTSLPLSVTATDDLTLLGTPPVTPTDTFDIQVNGSTYTITVPAAATLTDLQAAINALVPAADGQAVIGGTAANATLSFVSPYDFEITDTLGASAQTLFGMATPSTDFAATTFPSASVGLTYVDTLGRMQSLTLTFSNPVTIPGTSTTWQTTLTASDGTPFPGNGTMTFDSLGRAPATQILNITSTFGTPPATTTFDLDLSDVAMLGQSTVQVGFTQDGLESGAFEGFDIRPDGTIVGNYSGGGSQVLYRLPIAVFTNPDALQAVNGNMYLATLRPEGLDEEDGGLFSGEATFRLLGDEFAELNVGALEQSNVDLADNLSMMIVTQRAYSSAATVVRTADEMSTVVRDLMR
jgi:flagellar hook protein FlgE